MRRSMDGRWLARSGRFLSYPVFRKILASVVLFALYTWAEILLETRILGYDLEFPPGVHTLLGISLSMLMVFRNNSSYDRWWEGRKIWGQLVNTSRSLGALIHTTPGLSAEQRQSALDLVGRFPFALRDHLRGPWPPPQNQPQTIITQLIAQLQSWNLEGFRFLALERHINLLFDLMGGCERIRGTPLPLSHRAIVPQIVIAYLIALPWGLPNKSYTVLIVAVTAYFLVSLEMIAEELEEPFGQEPDDLPLSRTCLVIEKSLARMPGDLEQV